MRTDFEYVPARKEEQNNFEFIFYQRRDMQIPCIIPK